MTKRAERSGSADILWPEDLRPEISPVYSYNELTIGAPPEQVWAWLIQAERWPSWYFNCWRLRMENAQGPDLALGTRFSWITFGVRVVTTVEEFVPLERLAWRGEGLGAVGYHAWDLRPTAAGCHVVTEETQRGLVPRLLRPLFRRGLLYAHQRWLEGLERVAKGCLPSSGGG